VFSVEEYKIALGSKLSSTDRKMLRLNYESPNKTITASLMTHGMGWQGKNAGSLHYGKLGKKFAKALNHQMKPYSDGEIYDIHILVDFSSKKGFIEWILWENLAIALEELDLVETQKYGKYQIETEEVFLEGKSYKTITNKFERSLEARAKCIQHYKAVCFVCNFNFGLTYGEDMDGFIHVHHINPLSEIREEYIIDPIKDLRPVCPNCHAVIHSKRPAFSIEEVKAMLKRGFL
jgi:5-methylcytosine-specific restriction enzyme A